MERHLRDLHEACVNNMRAITAMMEYLEMDTGAAPTEPDSIELTESMQAPPDEYDDGIVSFMGDDFEEILERRRHHQQVSIPFHENLHQKARNTAYAIVRSGNIKDGLPTEGPEFEEVVAALTARMHEAELKRHGLLKN